MDPPAAGFSEIAGTLLVATTSVPYLKTFFSQRGEDDAQRMGARSPKLLDRDRRGRHGRTLVPFRVEVARVSEDDFYQQSYYPSRAGFSVHQPVADEERVRRLKAAQGFMESLTEEALDGSGGPPENGTLCHGRHRRRSPHRPSVQAAVRAPVQTIAARRWVRRRRRQGPRPICSPAITPHRVSAAGSR